ncbi:MULTISPECIES: zf-HC2 domain-containing protein [Micrococcaceae]|uniref:zf-HC2 domain-containing protein n=1 Tax=Micrococcaceae TaxID=1268 RepID=UPI001612E260|nr:MULTISPECIES: zf-HC2 domain-containing protein [Micrococcaceae]MBB5749379.1 putative anti-sigma-YlaC factor YlaD [Micrococcus sp. TA1]HRO29686.1 zf-HC2 domain-containing protein [Citricoccus sp.]HRO93907.1 zf-HC2 domain-containing protein [Citricoccus sp.]
MAVLHPRSRLDSFIEGALTPYSRARVSAHLADCSDCRREVGQRERILRAASSLGPVRGPSSDPSGPEGAGQRCVPVLERRDGVAGWKVVLGLGAVGLLTSGVLMSAWVAGDPEARDPQAGQFQFLSFAGDSSPVPEADVGRSAAASMSGASSGAASVSPVPDRAPAGSILSSAAGITPDTAGTLTPSMVTDLRQAGWNVPTFHGLGMPATSTGWQRGEGFTEVVMTLTGAGHTLEFHECRTLPDAEPVPSCPVGWDLRSGPAAERAAAPVTGPLSWTGADVVRLPVGLDMQLREHADGSWTAALATSQAGYTVNSDLPVESAPRVMSMVVISERSRVQGGAAPESPGDRLARGFERILPWTDGTDGTEPQRR